MSSRRSPVFGSVFSASAAPNFALLCNPTGGGVQVDPDIVPIADRSVTELKLQACDVVIGLTHMGLGPGSGSWPGKLTVLTSSLTATIASPFMRPLKTPSSFKKGQAVNILRYSNFTFQDGLIRNPSWKRILMDSAVGSDPEIQDLMETYMAAYEEGTQSENRGVPG
jgi:hypothetical protein